MAARGAVRRVLLQVTLPATYRGVATQSRGKPCRGFVGLGAMGRPMAMNLLRRGDRPVMVFDTRRSVAEDFRSIGADVASSISELGYSCDEIVLCLPDGEAVESVLFGTNDVDGSPPFRDSLKESALIIDCSTTGPATSRRVASQLHCKYVDAPVSGERKRAEDASLTIMVGGREPDFQQALPVLRTMATNITYMGPHGHGQLAKALNNCLYNISCAAMAEIMALAAKVGMDAEALAAVVSRGTGQSFGFDKFAPLVVERKFQAPEYGYPMGLAFKDMRVVAETASEHGIEAAQMPVVRAATGTYKTALDLSLGEENKGAMTKVLEREFGVTVGSRKS
eukprot:TRINITY_DN34655_c0_g1_i1.p1 TRINITY_DN34655_c0_g1~~TRINITY_DN34655_c0_g1_i1.p1  ORF type:complete len:338 (+),score=56.66 TRINITY_DN34655_c0_g1_i1:127-1140(+)